MKILLWFFVICCCIHTGCNRQKCQSDFMLNEPLASIVDSFTRIHPDQKVYELYINKVTEDSTVIILYAGEQSCTTREKRRNNSYQSAIQINLNGIPIDLYSGIELYVTNRQKNYTNRTQFNPKYAGGFGCIVFDINGKLLVDKERSMTLNYPFFPLPYGGGMKGMIIPPDWVQKQ